MLACMVCQLPASVDADWVFGYGSLIWNPEIDFEHAALARLHGYHRAFCIESHHYRGTPERPGVVLGLDRGGSCIGVVFRLRPRTRSAAIRHLYAREMPDWQEPVYRPMVVEVRMPCGRLVPALTFVADRERPAYRRLSDEEILQRLHACAGLRGANRDYAINTLHALEARGVHDPRLARLVKRLGAAPPTAQAGSVLSVA